MGTLHYKKWLSANEKEEGRARDGGVSGNLIILAHEQKVWETLISLVTPLQSCD